MVLTLDSDPNNIILLQNKQTSNREPRKQSHSSKANIVIVDEPELEQRPNVEAEILRNIDEEILDSLSPQPSIVNTITHGLQNKNSITKNSKEEGMHILFQ